MEINEERKNRYRSKMGYILEKMYTLPEDTSTLDELDIDGVLYRVQTSIDSAMDISAMLVRDIGIEVSDDYGNIEILKEKKLIDSDLSEELKRLNGMRNSIVHKYEGVNNELILRNIIRIKEILQRFVEIVEGELA